MSATACSPPGLPALRARCQQLHPRNPRRPFLPLPSCLPLQYSRHHPMRRRGQLCLRESRRSGPPLLLFSVLFRPGPEWRLRVHQLLSLECLRLRHPRLLRLAQRLPRPLAHRRPPAFECRKSRLTNQVRSPKMIQIQANPPLRLLRPCAYSQKSRLRKFPRPARFCRKNQRLPPSPLLPRCPVLLRPLPPFPQKHQQPSPAAPRLPASPTRSTLPTPAASIPGSMTYTRLAA